MAGGDDGIERAWRAGRAAHSHIDLGRAELAEFLAERAGVWIAGDDARAADLYLVCACLERVPQAVQAFMAAYIERIPAYLGRRVQPDLANDVKQQLAMRLLVGDVDKPPLLATYMGRGSLEGFVRVAAGRLAVDLQRSDARQPRALGSLVEDGLVADDLELTLLKDSYREPFRKAFAAAVGGLVSEHRALLRLHYVEGMTTEQLARLFKVGRATIVRRLGDARVALVTQVQERLTVGIEKEEFEGFLRMVRSQLDLSLVRLLRETMS